MLHIGIWCLHLWLASPMTAKCQAVTLQPRVCPWSITQIHMECGCKISGILPANFCSKGVLKHTAKAEQLQSVQSFETRSALPKLYLVSNQELSQAARFACFFSSSLRPRFSVKATMQELLNVLSSEMITPVTVKHWLWRLKDSRHVRHGRGRGPFPDPQKKHKSSPRPPMR